MQVSYFCIHLLFFSSQKLLLVIIQIFIYKNQNGNERFVASKQDFISYIFIHIAKCGIRIFCMLATPIYEKGITSLLFKVFPKPLIILIDMKRQFQLTFF